MPKTFDKSERLKREKVITALFRNGQSFAAYPLRLVWSENPPSKNGAAIAPVQLSISVPKKKFPHAVDRNLLRRRVREAYRLQKDTLYAALPPDAPPSAWMILYVAHETLPYSDIAKAMRKVFRKFLEMNAR